MAQPREAGYADYDFLAYDPNAAPPPPIVGAYANGGEGLPPAPAPAYNYAAAEPYGGGGALPAPPPPAVAAYANGGEGYVPPPPSGTGTLPRESAYDFAAAEPYGTSNYAVHAGGDSNTLRSQAAYAPAPLATIPEPAPARSLGTATRSQPPPHLGLGYDPVGAVGPAAMPLETAGRYGLDRNKAGLDTPFVAPVLNTYAKKPSVVGAWRGGQYIPPAEAQRAIDQIAATGRPYVDGPGPLEAVGNALGGAANAAIGAGTAVADIFRPPAAGAESTQPRRITGGPALPDPELAADPPVTSLPRFLSPGYAAQQNQGPIDRMRANAGELKDNFLGLFGGGGAPPPPTTASAATGTGVSAQESDRDRLGIIADYIPTTGTSPTATASSTAQSAPATGQPGQRRGPIGGLDPSAFHSAQSAQTTLDQRRAKMVADGALNPDGTFTEAALAANAKYLTDGAWNQTAVDKGIVPADALGKPPSWLHLNSVQKGTSLERVEESTASETPATGTATADNSGSSSNSGGDAGWTGSGSSGRRSSGGGGWGGSGGGSGGFSRRSRGFGDDAEPSSRWQDYLDDEDGDGRFSPDEIKRAKFRMKQAQARRGKRGRFGKGKKGSGVPTFPASPQRELVLGNLSAAFDEAFANFPKPR